MPEPAVQPAPAARDEPPAVGFNPFEPGFFDDPYRQYRMLRDHDPVHESALGVWILFGYEDCLRLLRDQRLSVDLANARPTARTMLLDELMEQRLERENRSILNIDPPDHTRLRRLVQKAFTPRVLERMRPRIQRLVDDVLDAAGGAGRMDVITDLAFPLPFTVIAEMLGMPDADRDQLRGWSQLMVKTLDPILTPDDVRAAADAGESMAAHIAAAIEWKRRHPADDLLSALIAAEEDGDMLSEEELTDQVMLLYIAGHETTVNLIGNGVLALLRHPDQWRRLVADPQLVAGAVEELLRYDSPVQFSRRITVTDLDIGGRRVPGGTFVMACLGSANRDSGHWGTSADELDITRPGAGQHLSFGNGAHYCLGANLARLEAQVTLATLARRCPDLAPEDDAAEWNGRIVLRGLDRLPVRLAP